MDNTTPKKKGAFVPVTSSSPNNKRGQSEVDTSTAPPPSGCFVFMCFAPGGRNVTKSKSERAGKNSSKMSSPTSANSREGTRDSGESSKSSPAEVGESTYIDSSRSEVPKGSTSSVSNPSDTGAVSSRGAVAPPAAKSNIHEPPITPATVFSSIASSTLPPVGGLGNFNMGDSGQLGYSASTESFSAGPHMQLQGSSHPSEQSLRQYPSNDVPQSKMGEPVLLSKSSFDYTMSAIRDTAAEVDSSKRLSGGRSLFPAAQPGTSASRDTESKDDGHASPHPAGAGGAGGGSRVESGEVSSELDAAPLSASERLVRRAEKSSSGSVDSRDRDRSSPMRMDSGAPLSTLPPISSSAHISSSGSRSTATAAFVAALKVNSNGQQSTQSSSTSTSSGSLGGAAAVIGPINTSGSGVVEWSKMFELTGVRFDKTQPGPGESVPTLGDQHLLKLEEAFKQNIQKVNVERNRTALARNPSFNIASVIDLAGAIMPSPPPTGSGVTSAAASYLAAGGSTAQCSKLVDLSLAYTEILQLQNRPKEAVKVLSKVIEDVNTEMAELVRRYGLSSGKPTSSSSAGQGDGAPLGLDRSALPSSGGAAEAMLEKSSGVTREEYDEIRRLKALCHRRIGSMYMSLGKYKQAEDHIKKYLSYLEKQRKISSSANQRVERSYAYSVLSSIYDATERPEEAMAADLKSMELSLQYRKSLGAAGGVGIGGSAAAPPATATATSPSAAAVSSSSSSSSSVPGGVVRNASRAVQV